MEAVTLVNWAFDGVLAVSLLLLAWQALASFDLFKACALFVIFGVFMAIAWVRLNAPDVGLAEATIGAGITGTLLMSALSRLSGPGVSVASGTGGGSSSDVTQRGNGNRPPGEPETLLGKYVPLLLVSALAIGLGYVVLSLPPQASGLHPEVAGRMESSGVEHPVTGVLLNFRGYDTLLELVVLLSALLGAWSLGGLRTANFERAPDSVLDILTRSLTPVSIVVAGYLLWVGTGAPGGAFQAGAVLGAASILLLLSGWQLPRRLAKAPFRIALVMGVVVFLAVAVLVMAGGRSLLEYPPANAGMLILVIEIFASVSIGATLVGFFLGADPADEQKQ
jgi:multisubunit Na+/H+ antiporter MnhB subunit